MTDQDVIIDNKPTVTTDPFDGMPSPRMEFSKQEEPVIIEKKDEPVIVEKKEEPVVIEKKDEPVIIEDGRAFLKEKLGYEDWDAAKNEIETLRTKATPEAIDTKRIKELYSVIDKKEKLEQLTTGDITRDNAAIIVKTAMQEKYKLNQAQIDYKFNKQFGMPKEPVQAADELDDDFLARQNNWKEQVSNAEMDLLIEANMVRPELEKINSELKLPEIVKTEIATKEPTPEELAKAQEGRNLFIQDAEAELKKFEGFNAAYKDKDVEVLSSYKLSDVENKNVLNTIKELAENAYNANAIFSKRWGKDGQFSFTKMVKDFATLEAEDSRSQKYIGDAVAKAKLQYMKQKHNIDLDNGNGGGELQLEDKQSQKKNEDAIWN